MNAEAIIKAAIPGAPEWVVEHIVWERTPYPVGAITPRSLYKAASGYRRACEHGIELCTFCDRPARAGDHVIPACQHCDDALTSATKEGA